ncbi:MAG: GSU2403 family nucleotidyltransferase fold protein [Pseudomonadota bacterium]
MAFKSHSALGHTAYADLLRLLHDDDAAGFEGSIRRKTIRGKTYLYETFRIGQKMKDRYLGEATAELEDRISKAEALRAQTRERRTTRTRLVRRLRAEGYLGFDTKVGALLTALARIGVFRLGGTLVGTLAFRLYEGELGMRMTSDQIVQTGDVDIASFERLSLALGDTVTEPVSDVLARLNLGPVPALRPGHVWRWQDIEDELMVEFLTPAFGDEGLRKLPALGVSAQALHYLNFLLADPIKAVALYRSGILVQIPRPEAYAIHKLIVADRRQAGPDELKSRKDRAQAALLVEALAEMRPDELAEAYTDALSRGPRWRARIEASLKRMPETAERLGPLA